MEKILEKWKQWSVSGVHLPFVHDPVTEKPSITLMFVYISFMMTAITIGTLAFKDLYTASIMGMIFWVLAFVFYSIRRIKTFKADLDDKSISLEGEENNDK